MTQEETWNRRYNEIVAFIEREHRNPSRYNPEERGLYVNWLKANRKLMNADKMSPERVSRFKVLLELIEANKHVNQYG